MYRSHVLTAVAVFALIGAGCQNTPTAPPRLPEGMVSGPPAPAPPPSLVPYVDPGFPPAPAGATVYGRISPSSISGAQRYILDDTRFTLQYLRPNGALYQAAGSISRTATGLRFVFDANGGRWQAEAAIDGELLVARYNLEATLDDFEDGIYERQPAPR